MGSFGSAFGTKMGFRVADAITGKGNTGLKEANEAAAELDRARADAVERETELKEKAAETERQNTALTEIRGITVSGDSAAIINGVQALIPFLNFASGYPELKETVWKAAADKLEFALIQLRNTGDTANADFFQKKIDESAWGCEKARLQQKAEKKAAMKGAVGGFFKDAMNGNLGGGGLGGLFGKKK
jgi:hypothetical protein